MKKSVLALGLAGCLQFPVHAQKSVANELPSRLFQQGKEMFLDKNYVGTLHRMAEFKKLSNDKKMIVEADYLIISSLYYQGNPTVLNQLKDYLDTYPETYHRQEIAFFIGSIHFEDQEWAKADYWLSQADLDYLSPVQQEDCSFRLAYSYLQEKKYDESYRLFGLLSERSSRYNEDANYYKAYIDFQKKRYQSSTPVFERLTRSSKYKELASFYLLQTSFAEGKMNETITSGEAYLEAFPKSAYSGEVYRILGNSYYRKGIMVNSISNYENYLKTTDKPFREDMLFLGSAYYGIRNYSKSVESLKKAVAYSDEVGQEAYMQLGLASEKLGDSSNALLAFQAASKMNYNRDLSEKSLYNYAMLLHQSSLAVFDQSISVFQQFLQQYPNSKYSDNINDALASTLLSTKNYPAALSAINAIKSPGKSVLEAKQMILLQLGIQHYINGDTNNAIQRFNETVAMGSYNPKARNQAYFWRGESFYKLANYTAATRDYEAFMTQAGRSDENYNIARYDLGYAYFKLNQYNKANAAFLDYIEVENNKLLPNYSDALNRIGDGYLFARNYSEANRYYSRSANQNPQNADYAEFQKAFVLGLQRDYNGKISALDQLMAKYPQSQYYDDALYEKARALAMLDKEKEAIPVLERLLKNHSGSLLAQKGGIQLGQMYYNTNQPQKAIETYKDVVKNYPDTEESRIAVQSMEGIYKDINDIDSYASYVNSLGSGIKITSSRQDSLTFLAAESIFMKGQRIASKNAFNKYLQSFPKGYYSADAHYYLGAIALDEKNKTVALNEFRQSNEGGNSRFLEEALSEVADLEFNDKNYAGAYQHYFRLSGLTQKAELRDQARIGMLRCAAYQNKDQEVILAANQIVGQSKTTPEILKEAYFYRGKAYLNLKESDKAMADLRECAADPRYVQGAEAQFILADTFYKWKSYDKAIAQVTEFMKKGTPHEYWMARALIVLSDSYAAKGDKFSAKQYLESLKDNYKGGEADIDEMVSSRLSKMN